MHQSLNIHQLYISNQQSISVSLDTCQLLEEELLMFADCHVGTQTNGSNRYGCQTISNLLWMFICDVAHPLNILSGQKAYSQQVLVDYELSMQYTWHLYDTMKVFDQGIRDCLFTMARLDIFC